MHKFQKLRSLFIIKPPISCLSCYFSQAMPKLVPEKKLTATIKCKRKEFDLLEATTYKKFEEIPLVSKGWTHRKSKGDYFTIYPVADLNPSPDEKPLEFSDLGLSAEIIFVLRSIGINEPTKIQMEAIQKILTGRNCLLTAETGCGKTLAFLLPMIQQIVSRKNAHSDRDLNSPLGLILLPSRELAHQIGELATHFADRLDFTTKVIVGGRTKRQMLNPSFEKIDLLVATIGAISKLTTTGIYRMGHVNHLVMDEADTLLDDSFNEKLKHFLRRFQIQYGGFSESNSSSTQLTLVSATMPTGVSQVLGEIIPTESFINITSNRLHKLIVVPHKFMRVGRSEKATQLLRLVKGEFLKRNPVIVFSNKSTTCDWVSYFLNMNGIKCINLHGDMPLVFRQGKFKEFQDGLVNVISCTDIGSRGLDTVRVKHVLNFDFPLHTADYIHRSGRTGRVGSYKNCQVTNLISSPREIEIVQNIERATRLSADLPNVNGNITQIITNKVLRGIREDINRLD